MLSITCTWLYPKARKHACDPWWLPVHLAEGGRGSFQWAVLILAAMELNSPAAGVGLCSGNSAGNTGVF